MTENAVPFIRREIIKSWIECSSDNTKSLKISEDSIDKDYKEWMDHMSPYQIAMKSLNEINEWKREINLSKRVGLYQIRGQIGSGNFAQVKLAYHSLLKEKVAVKILDKAKLDLKAQRVLNHEIISMERLHHPNIIRLFQVIETYSNLYYFLEYAPYGELFQRITNKGPFPEEEAKIIFAQLVSAIEHMHQHNIIHRDIKAENVFFADKLTIKLGDFGFSAVLQNKDDLLNTFCGSPPYAAPELFNGNEYNGQYVDLWALGVILYFMVTAKMPFTADKISALKKIIMKGQYCLPLWLSSQCSACISGLLQHIPRNRLSIQQLKVSEWLVNSYFPEPIVKYTDYILDHDRYLIKEEKKTLYQLIKLGITPSMISEDWDKGVRSDLIGIYRIILQKNLSNNSVNRSELTETYSRSQEMKDSKTEIYNYQNFIIKERENLKQNSLYHKKIFKYTRACLLV